MAVRRAKTQFGFSAMVGRFRHSLKPKSGSVTLCDRAPVLAVQAIERMSCGYLRKLCNFPAAHGAKRTIDSHVDVLTKVLDATVAERKVRTARVK